MHYNKQYNAAITKLQDKKEKRENNKRTSEQSNAQ